MKIEIINSFDWKGLLLTLDEEGCNAVVFENSKFSEELRLKMCLILEPGIRNSDGGYL